MPQFKKQIVLVAGLLASLVAASAMAQVASSPSGSTTRAQVKADAVNAERAGQLPVGDLDKTSPRTKASVPASAPSGLTRAQVKTETAQARKAGQIPHGELDETATNPSNSSRPAANGGGLTRAQVAAQTKAAAQAGQLQFGDEGKTQAEADPPRYAGSPASAPKLSFRRKSSATTASSAPTN